MGSRGPIKKPASHRRAEGKDVKPSEASEPVKAPRGSPPMPAGLNRRAQAAWRQLASELSALGLLARTDGAQLEAAASLIARAREARTRVNRDGLFTHGSTGQLREHPGVKIERDSWAQARQLLEAMGLSPAARLRMQMPVGGAGGQKPAEPVPLPQDEVTARIGASPRTLRAVKGRSGE